jgi:hypothetical protein
MHWMRFLIAGAVGLAACHAAAEPSATLSH